MASQSNLRRDKRNQPTWKYFDNPPAPPCLSWSFSVTGVFESLLHLDGCPHLDHNLLHGTCDGHHYRHIIIIIIVHTIVILLIIIFLILLLVIVTWSGHFAEQVCHHLRMAKMAIVKSKLRIRGVLQPPFAETIFRRRKWYGFVGYPPRPWRR